MGRAKSVRACTHCRQRHVKCDREEPSCRRCQHLKLTCKRSAVNGFRNIIVHNKLDRTHQKFDSEETPGQDNDPAAPSQALFQVVDETTSVVKAHENKSGQRAPAAQLTVSVSNNYSSESRI